MLPLAAPFYPWAWICDLEQILTAPCAFHAVYFVQGILGLARLAVTFFYKDELHLDPVCIPNHSPPPHFLWPRHTLQRQG